MQGAGPMGSSRLAILRRGPHVAWVILLRTDTACYAPWARDRCDSWTQSDVLYIG